MKNFVIVGSQRTGTSLINSTLGTHPDIQCFGEIFLYRGGRGQRVEGSYRQYINQKLMPRAITNHIGRPRLINGYLDQLYKTSNTKAVGFKFMLDQAHAFPDAVEYIRRHQILILHVIRENALKTLVSRISARSRKLYHSSVDTKVEKIHLPVSKLRKSLEKIQAEASEWKVITADNPYLSISYELLSVDRELELSRTLQFLGVQPVDTMVSSLKKINSDNLADVIENYADVEKELSGTSYEKYLN